jgi:hypothetical protein
MIFELREGESYFTASHKRFARQRDFSPTPKKKKKYIYFFIIIIIMITRIKCILSTKNYIGVAPTRHVKSCTL